MANLQIRETEYRAALRRIESLTSNKILINAELAPNTAAKITQQLRTIQVAPIAVRLDANGLTAEANRVRTLLQGLNTNVSTLFQFNTTGLQAISQTVANQITQLNSLIQQLRQLGGSAGPGGGGNAGAGNRYARELAALAGDLRTGAANTAQYEAALRRLEAAVQGDIAALRQLGPLTQAQSAQLDGLRAAAGNVARALQGINTDRLTTLRGELATARAAFDQAAGAATNLQQRLAARTTYEAELGRIRGQLVALGQSGQLTASQLLQMENVLGRVARESNTINGRVNVAGLSGNVLNSLMAFGGAVPGISLASTALGAFSGASGAAGVAAAGLGLGVGALAIGFVKLGQIGLDETKKVQRGINVLVANGETDVPAFQKRLDALQESLGRVGQAFSRGDLTIATAGIRKAGVETSDALTLMATSTKLAAAENISLNDASQLLLKNLRQYQLDVGSAAKVGDMLATAGNLAAGSANDLSVGMGIVAGTGRAAKVEMYDLLGMLVELDNKGMSAADVGANGLRAALAGLSDITDKGAAALTKLGVAFLDNAGHARPAGDILIDLAAKLRSMGITADKSTGALIGNGDALATVSSIMDTRAAAAVLNLTGDYKTYAAQIRDSEGALTSYSDTMSTGAEQAQKRLNTAIQNTSETLTKTFAGSLADVLDNSITPFIKGLEDVLNRLGSLDKQLSGLKDTADIKMALKIDWVKDDGFVILSKLFKGGVQQFRDLGRLATGGGSDAQQVQRDLLDRGLIQQQGSIGGAKDQLRTIEQNLDYYVKMLADHAEQIGKAGKVLNTGLNTTYGQLGLLNNPAAPKSGAVPGITALAALGIGGKRGTPFGGTYFGGQVHNGEDLFAPTGSAVAAPFTGMLSTRWSKTTGNIVEIVDAQGRKILLGHLEAYAAGLQDAIKKAGGRLLVQAGTVVGTVGQTGSLAHKDLGPGNSHVHAMAYDAQGRVIDPTSASFSPMSGKGWTGSGSAAAWPTTIKIPGMDELTAKANTLAKALHDAVPGTAEWTAADIALRKFGKSSYAAAAAVRGAQQAIALEKKALGEHNLTQAEWNRLKGEAVKMARLQEQLDSGKLSEKAAISAQRDIAAYQAKGEAEKSALAFARDRLKQQADLTQQAERDRKKTEQEQKRIAKEQERSEKDAAQKSAQIAESLRQGQIKIAQAQLTELSGYRTRDLQAAGDSAAKQEAVEKRYAQRIYDAKKAIADAEYADAKRDAQNGPAQLRDNALQIAEKAHTQALRDAKTERDGILSAATKKTQEEARKQAEAVQGLADKYTAAQDQLRGKAESGQLDGKAAGAYLKTLADLWGDVGQAGLKASPALKTAHEQAVSFLARAVDVNGAAIQMRAAAGEFDHITDGHGSPVSILQGLDSLIPLLPKSQAEVAGFTRAMGELADQNVISRDTLRDIINLIPDFQQVFENALSGASATRERLAQELADAAQQQADASQQAVDEMNAASVQAAQGFFGGKSLEEQLAAGQDMLSSSNFWIDFTEEGRAEFMRLWADVQARFGDVAENIRTRFKTEMDQAAQDVANAADTALADKNSQDNTFVKGLSGSASGLTGFLAGDGGPFGQNYWTNLGEEGRAAFTAELNKLKPEDFAFLGESTLRGLIQGIGDDPDWADLKTNLMAGLDKAVQGATPALAEVNAGLTDLVTRGAEIQDSFESGKTKLEDYGQSLLGLEEDAKRYAKAARAMGNEELAQQFDAIAAAAGAAVPEITRAQQALEKVVGLGNGINDLAGAFGNLFGAFGGDGFSKIFSGLGGLVKVGTDGFKAVTAVGPAFAKSFGDGLSAIGGVVGIAGTAVNLIGSIGDSILALDPGFQAWKKGLLEVAEAEKKVSQESAGLFKNYFSAALQQDAANRESLANAGFWQWVGWSLFGGAPQVLSDEAAKLKISAAQIFGDLAGGLSDTLINGVMNAFDTGDWSKVDGSIDKFFDGFIARTVLKAMIAKTNIEELINATSLLYAEFTSENSEMGTDLSPGEMATLTGNIDAIKRKGKAVVADFQKIAPSLGGAATPAADPTAASNSNSVSVTASPQISSQIAQINFDVLGTLSSAVSTNIPIFATSVVDFRAGTAEFRATAAEIRMLVAELKTDAAQTDWGGNRGSRA